MRRYEEVGEAYLFFLRPILDDIPKNKRRNFKSKLIKELKKYKFQPKKKNEPPHPNSIEVRGKYKEVKRNYNNPKDIFDVMLIQMHPYYVARTQNRIKKYIENNL